MHPQEIRVWATRERVTQAYIDASTEAYIAEFTVGRETIGAAMREALTAQAHRQQAAHTEGADA